MSEDRSAWGYTRPPGIQDGLGPEAWTQRCVEERVLRTARRYGYAFTEPPALDYADLYHRDRVGDELFNGVMLARLAEGADFPARAAGGEAVPELVHDVVLRPEFTAPLARALVSRMLDEGRPRHWPLRVAYAGPVFRDLRPRPPLRLRQFRQVGVELVGGAGRAADLEVLSLACDAAAALGLPDWELRLGHAGLYQALLRAAGVGEALLAVVSRGVEHLARLDAHAAGSDAAWRRYAEGAAADLRDRRRAEGLAADPALAGPEAAPDALRGALAAGFRALFRRQWGRRGLAPAVIDRLFALADVQGAASPAALAALPEARRDEVAGPLDELGSLWSAVEARHPGRVRLTPAASRGIAYYTGMTFEIHSAATGDAYTDVCGGGRYDGLHRWIHDRTQLTRAVRGHREPPESGVDDLLCGVGFAFGVERVAAAVGPLRDGLERPVFVAVLESERVPDAVRVADQLRGQGLAAVAELVGPAGGLGLREQLGRATGHDARHVLILGGEEWARGEVGLRDLDRREQRALPLADAIALLR